MFDHEKMKKAPELEKTYNELSQDYAENVVPYRQLTPLNKYESKKLTANNMIKELLANDEFKLGLGKKYPQIQVNRALRSGIAKKLGTGLLAGLGFEEGRRFIK